MASNLFHRVLSNENKLLVLCCKNNNNNNNNNNAFGKMVLVDLLNTWLPQTFNL